MLTKAVLLAGSVTAAARVLTAADAAGLLVDADGATHEPAGLGRFKSMSPQLAWHVARAAGLVAWA